MTATGLHHGALDLPSGWLSDAEALALADLVRGKTVLEIGSFLGRSTVAMARDAEHVFALDHHRGSPEHQHGGWARDAVPDTLRYGDGVDTLAAFIANLTAYGVRDRVTLLVGTTARILPLLDYAVVDVVFVDGSHDEDSVYADACAAFQIAQESVAFHDTNDDDVARAINRAARDTYGEWAKLSAHQAGSLLILHVADQLTAFQRRAALADATDR